MTFQMNRAAASIYLLIKLHAAFFAETPAFHMFFKSVFHYHPASINESVWRYGTSLVRMCIPYIPQAFMIFCNKGLLEECGVTEYPQTWEELMDACEKVKAAGHMTVHFSHPHLLLPKPV